MPNHRRFVLLSIMAAFVLVLSAAITMPVYADGGTPPVESPQQAEAEGEAEADIPLDDTSDLEEGMGEETDQTPPEPDPAADESTFPELPADTQLIVVDEDGEPLPLASQEAADALSFIDPVWCPVGVTPKDGTGGCTPAYGSLYELIFDIANNVITEPGKAGVIWIQAGADASANPIIIDGSDPDLGSWSDFALTLQGGWNGMYGSTAIIGVSTFSQPISIINWNAPVTINNVTIAGATGDGLNVTTSGNIVLKNVQSNNNSGRGAYLDNSAGVGNVTVANSQFNGNMGVHGLNISSRGIITLKDVTANSNVNGYGAVISNDNALTPKPITLSGVNSFSGNGTNVGFSGLFINSIGSITISNLIASQNGYIGAEIYNDNSPVPSGVTLTGFNIFSDNLNTGLYISTVGAVKASNLYANSNNQMGVQIVNSNALAPQGVTISGTNEFKYNTTFGLSIASKGVITLNNINANSNVQTGVSINNSGPTTSSVNITGTNTFNLNGNSGLVIEYTVAGGAVTLSNITANGNGTSLSGYGISVINHVGTTFKGVTLTGTNSFVGNYDNGINIITSGPITLNNITQSGTLSGRGVELNNAPSGHTKPQAVVINGLNNTFNNNNADGLYINTYGAVTLNNITANNNGLGMSFGTGLYITNYGSDKPQNVTIKGNNSFINNYEDGLSVISKGAVLTNAIIASDNDGYGVLIVNTFGTGNVTMTGNNLFTNNQLDNLYIQSAGVIALNSITANSSDTGMGANISNVSSTTPKNVTLSGTNKFNDNDKAGLLIQSKGIITTNNLEAINNGFGNNDLGVFLYNIPSLTKAGVNVNGTNIINGNASDGLSIFSNGNVKINNVSANSNVGAGLNIIGTFLPISDANGSATLTGTNTFNGNGEGVNINVYGTVTLNNISATNNTTGSGVIISNTGGGNTAPKPVILNGKNTFSNNSGNGLSISTYGAVTLFNVTASNNTATGANINNSGSLTLTPVTLNGTNLFDDNGSDNLNISSRGLIKINNITSTNAGNRGAAFSNSNGTAGVTITGTNNYFDSNTNAGLYIVSGGVVTLSNITSTNSATHIGAQITNTSSGFAAPKNVTLTGTNNFSGNNLTGLMINTYGSVTINNLTANDNGSNITYGAGAEIINYFGDNTIVANVTLTGNNTFLGNYTQGLYIAGFGAIKVNNVIANNNGGTASAYGVWLNNSNAPSNAYGVTMTGNNTFSGNGNDGLHIDTKGAVLLNNINITFNSSNGLYVDNAHAGVSAPKPVTITGTNNFSDNVAGFYINSNGAVTISKVTASNNTAGSGGYIVNNLANTPANVTITGYGVFNNNTTGNGLYILTKGAVTLTNITTIGNTFSGLDVNNSNGTGNVTITGTNTFNNNGDNGATINSNGNVSITKIFGDQNGQSGLVVVTTGTVTLTCGGFYLNTLYGWEIYNVALAVLKGVYTAGNGLGDYNTALVPPQLSITRVCPLP